MRIVELMIVKDILHGDMIALIPSTYSLCRMYDDKSVKLKITVSEDLSEELNLSDYEVKIRFISGHNDLGIVDVIPDNNEYYYPISLSYTEDPSLEIQVILVNNDENIRTNIVSFVLANSLPQNMEVYQNLSLIRRLVADNVIYLESNEKDGVLNIYDNLQNLLASIDISNYLLGRKLNED